VAAVTNYYRHLIDGDFQEGEREQAEQDIQAVFSRPWTKFLVGGEHGAQVTDPATTGPRGTFAGTVGAVIPGTPDRLRFQLKNITLEKHDGLQVEPAGRERPFGFPVSDIYAFQQGGLDKRERVFTAAPATTVEVPLPPEHPELIPGQNIYCTSSQQVKKRYHWDSIRPALIRERIPAACTLSITDAGAELSLASGAAQCSASYRPESALAPAKSDAEGTAANLRKCLAKLGDTPFTLTECAIHNPGNLFMPASVLNELRRQCTAALEEKLDEQRRRRQEMLAAADREPLNFAECDCGGSRRWIIKIDRPYALNLFTQDDFAGIHEVIIELGGLDENEAAEQLANLRKRMGGCGLRISLPTIMRRGGWQERIAALAALGFRKWQISNPGALAMLAAAGITPEKDDITADWQMYVCNTAAARELLAQGLKRICTAPDDTIDNTLAILPAIGPAAEVIVFQDTPLALSAACANASLRGGCPGKRSCDFRQMQLTSRSGQQLIAVNNNCQSVFINERTMDRSAMSGMFVRAGAGYLRADFIWREWTPAAIRQVWDKLTR
ncbi:MAG: DUF3656 domain-containing protein, partial [Victivallales bacterium]|nr:DUF3656 domain-containing protein [Victivallales bacterium]